MSHHQDTNLAVEMIRRIDTYKELLDFERAMDEEFDHACALEGADPDELDEEYGPIFNAIDDRREELMPPTRKLLGRGYARDLR